MDISKEEYFFYEWLILDKGITHTQLAECTDEEWLSLQKEYSSFKSRLIPKEV